MLKKILCLCLFVLTSSSMAEPAAWYWWFSKISDAKVCSQTSPGDGWTQGKTAFSDPQCQKQKPAVPVIR
jgi:hypothetical protein